MSGLKTIKEEVSKSTKLRKPPNKIDLEALLNGKDPRTTLMIKNIPNKFNQT